MAGEELAAAGAATGNPIAAIAGPIIGGLFGSKGSKKQAEAAQEGARLEAQALERAAELQNEQYLQSREDILPYLGAGEQSLYRLMALQGIDMPYAQGQGGYYDELQGLDSQIYELGRELEVDPYGDLSQVDTPEITYKSKADQYLKDTPTLMRIGNRGGQLARARKEDQQIVESKEYQNQEKLNQLRDLIERKKYLEGKITPVKSDPSKIYELMEASPDYQFALGQGKKAVNLQNLRRGAIGDTRNQEALMKFGQGLATQTLGNYRNSLMGLSQGGQQAGGQIGSLGASAAGRQGQLMGGAGAARSSGYQAKGAGYMNSANALTGAIGDAYAMNYLYNR